MANSYRVRPQARLDVVELARFIKRQSPQAATRFQEACQTTFKLLGSSPGLGGPYPADHDRLQGLRVFPVRGFPNYLIYYFETSPGVEVYRVIHGARDIAAALLDSSR